MAKRATGSQDGTAAKGDGRGRQAAPDDVTGGAEPREAGDAFTVRALARGLRVLSLFTVDHPEWSLSELTRVGGLHKATTYRILRTMEAEGFVVFDSETGLYHPGPALVPFAYLAESESELVRVARPHLEGLAQMTGETVNLAVEIDGTVMIADQVLTANPFKPNLPVGRVLRGLANSHGKLFAAFGPAARRRELLAAGQPRLTERTITDPERLAREIERVRAEGVAYDLEENGLGICSVAAPVFARNGEVRATISVVAPTERFGADVMARDAEAVRSAAASVSAYFGYDGDGSASD